MPPLYQMRTTVPVVPVKFNWRGFCAALLLFCGSTAAGQLSEPQRIHSPELGYDLQYRVYQPEGFAPGLPTLYVTDGEAYLQSGQMAALLDNEIATGHIEPLLVVFVDSRNPDNLKENRRHKQFMCNQQYAAFYRQQLLPKIGSDYQVSADRQHRVILGFSFGAINSACFGLLLEPQFAGIAMQSPGNSQHLQLLSKMYGKTEPLALRFFLSMGTKNDNISAGRKFHRLLEQKGYPVLYQEVAFGHDWRNWKPLLPAVLRHFFARPKADPDSVGQEKSPAPS